MVEWLLSIGANAAKIADTVSKLRPFKLFKRTPKSNIQTTIHRVEGLVWRTHSECGAIVGEPAPFCPRCDLQIRIGPDNSIGMADFYYGTRAACDRPGCGFEVRSHLQVPAFYDLVYRIIEAELRTDLTTPPGRP